MSLVLTVIMVLSLAGCGKSTELSSVSRDPATDDGTVWFDEEAVALAGSVRKAGMSEAELARADELRAMAIDALDIVNAKRAENGLAALNWSNGLESCAMVRCSVLLRYSRYLYRIISITGTGGCAHIPARRSVRCRGV